jgi:DNA polymerase III alpha subunit
VYIEQVMLLSQSLADFTKVKPMRKAMGKEAKEVLDKSQARNL